MDQIFLHQIKIVNEKIIKGQLDESLRLLVESIDYYQEHNLLCDIPNVFDKASNVIEGFSKRTLLLKTLKRIIDIGNDRKVTLNYVKYYALAHALYGAPEKALEILGEYRKEMQDGYYIELQNVKGIVLSKLDRYDEALQVYLENYELTKKINYKSGLRFIHNIGSAYARLHEYDKAINYIKKGIEFDFENGYITNGVMAMIELADVYVSTYQFDFAKRMLKKVMNHDVVTENQNMYLQFCTTMYKYNKAIGKYQDALFYHEILKDLEIQQNMEYYSGLLTTQLKNEDEIELIDHEIMADKLRNSNKFLKKTIAKSHEVQQELMAKNQELEATMESLNSTQEKLLVAEKRNVLDSMFINIANHMSTPLGVMNTSTSHIKNINSKTKKKFEDKALSKNDLTSHLEEIDKTVILYEESMNKVIGFVDTLKLYRTNDSEEVKHINVKAYLEELALRYKKFNGIEDIGIICHSDTTLYINTSLFDKCIDLVSKKLLINAERNGFDMEVSTESNIVTIGVGDFKSITEVEESTTSLVDSYDLYIIRTIVENLLGGRFIKFRDRGRDYYQFIFNLES